MILLFVCEGCATGGEKLAVARLAESLLLRAVVVVFYRQRLSVRQVSCVGRFGLFCTYLLSKLDHTSWCLSVESMGECGVT